MNSGVIGVALAFAPPVSGLIITCVGLRPLFLIPAVIALVLIIAGRPAIHNLYMRRKAHIDIPSVALSFVGLACFLYGLNEISHEVFPPLVIMARRASRYSPSSCIVSCISTSPCSI